MTTTRFGLIVALASLLLSAATQTRAQLFESFEGGDSTGWAATGTNTIAPSDALPAAASHGTYALEVTSSATGWDQQFKRENLLADLQNYSSMELDVYVPTLGPGFANAQLVINSDTGGFQSSYDYSAGEFPLVQGMNHLTWDYGADNVPMGGTWGIFQLVTVTDDLQPNPISPYYVDSFCLTNGEACGPPPPTPYVSSFENSVDGWTQYDSPNVPVSVNAAGGAPPGAITDGDYALKIAAEPSGDWTILTRLDHSSELIAAVHDHDTLEMDIFIEDGEILPEGFTSLGFNLNHEQANELGGFMTTYRSFTPGETGTSYHFSWKYADDPTYNPDTTWAQFQMISVATDVAEGADPIDEFFIDNFRFTSSPETAPGDFDEDGDVDGNDFLLWQRDTSVGSLTEWQEYYGSVAGSTLGAISAVPEPTTAILCLIGSALLVARRRSCFSTIG